MATTVNIADDREAVVPVYPTSQPISIGRVFRNTRINLGMSQREFAKALGCDFRWLSRLENDRLPIPQNYSDIIRLIPKLAAMAGLDTDWLTSLEFRYSEPSRSVEQVFVEYRRGYA